LPGETVTEPYLKQRDSAKAPAFKPPAGACDCHSHVIGDPARYPFTANRSFTPAVASHGAFRAMLDTLGIDRMVIVQPSVYGLDNSCTLDAIAALGVDRCRGVAAIEATLDQKILRAMDQGGIRAARFITTAKGGTGLDQFRAVAEHIAPVGWHLEMYTDAKIWRELTPTVKSLPIQFVIDHMGKLPANADPDSEDFRGILALLDTGKCWIKLCGYRNSVAGHPYKDVAGLARRLIAHAPERCVWGTDWPHTNLKTYMPDDGELLDLLHEWAPDEKTRHRILVDNPARLYRFAATGTA
jgi:predicted TIM-barrel fold metal-dependent hydrolase